MAKQPKRPRDVNQLAKFIVDRSVGNVQPGKVVRMDSHKNPAAVALGRKGGKKSAAARMEKIAPDERRRIASHAARARWERERGDD
jgi:hypothetical protein